MNNRKLWTTRGFKEFRRGTFGNGGQNLYVSRNGILQRIHQTDVTGNGYVDLVFCNSQNHEEKVPLDVYPDPAGNPALCEKLNIGGARSGVVADLTGNGWEDLVIACGWDGMSKQPNSFIFYGSEEGLTSKYLNYIPAPLSTAVAAGDFNGDAKLDLVFYSEKKLKIFYQTSLGFAPNEYITQELADVSQLTAAHFNGSIYADLLIRKEDGGCSIIRGSEKGLRFDNGEEILFGKDENFVQKVTGMENYTQVVAEPSPRIQVISLNGTQYICVFRIKETILYPYESYKTGSPIVFKCQNAMAIAAGDISSRGVTDIVFACRDKSSGTECSWIYPGSSSGWLEKDRILLKTLNACDTVLADFSGNGGLDIVIGQSHSHESFTSEVLLFPVSGMQPTAPITPIRLPSHDAYRVFAVNTGKNRKPHLVISNYRSGSLIGNPDNAIYMGGPDGFKVENSLALPGWGSTDMVCCDLNDNGHPDIVFSNAAELSPWLDPGSYVYYNSQGGFNPYPPLSLLTTRAHGVVCGDLNHDGWLDLIFCGFDNPKIKVFYGSANGFSEKNSKEIIMEYEGKIYKEPRFLALADLNNDGWLDLVIPIINEEESFVLWGGPDGFSFDNKQVFKVRHACNAKVADLNNDGYPELIFGGHTQSISGAHDSFVYIYWGSPEGYSEDRRTLIPSNAVNSMAVADFDNDGFLDLFVGSYEDGRLRDIDSHIYWNQQGKGFLPHKRLPLRTHAVSGNLAADFNGDGWIDLAIANHKVEGNHIAYSTTWHNGPDGFDEKRNTNLPTSGPHGMGNVDPGNIMDRTPNEYYISAPHQMLPETGIREIYWTGDVPNKSWVKAQFRFAESTDGLEKSCWMGATGTGTWFTAHQRVDKTLFSGKWVQYRLCLGSFNSVNTPRISEVTVGFESKETS
ncbi:MAG: VCBS repeat-containing protein [Victivallales bacterium]